jgi:hypothetical protein
MRIIHTNTETRTVLLELLRQDPSWLPAYFIECPHGEVRFGRSLGLRGFSLS